MHFETIKDIKDQLVQTAPILEVGKIKIQKYKMPCFML